MTESSHDDPERPRGVGSLLSRFEALAAQTHLPGTHSKHLHHVGSANQLGMPHDRDRRRSMSTPLAEHLSHIDAPGAKTSSPLTSEGPNITTSKSQPDLMRGLTLSSHGGWSSMASSTSGSPSVQSLHESDIQQQREAPYDPVGPDIPARPNVSAAEGASPGEIEKTRKGPPPPIPIRKKAATVPFGLMEQQDAGTSPAAPPVPPRIQSPGASISNSSMPISSGSGTRSPSPNESHPMPMPATAMPMDHRLANSRSPSPLQFEESEGHHSPAPIVPPRPNLDPSGALSPPEERSRSPGAPPLVPRRPISPALVPFTDKPPIPRRDIALASSLPSAFETSGGYAAATALPASDLAAMTQRMSDQGGAAQKVRPPPPRTIGQHEKVQPIRPAGPSPATYNSDSEVEEEDLNTIEKRATDDAPDATYASRRAPELRPPRVIHSKANITSVTAHGTNVVTCGLHHVRVYDVETCAQKLVCSLPGEPKTAHLEFRGPRICDSDENREDDGRHVWVGTKDGHLYSIDLQDGGSIVNSRAGLHTVSIMGIFRRRFDMLTLDESGKLQVWLAIQNGRECQVGLTQPKTYRVDKPSFAALLGDNLWTASTIPRTGTVAAANRAPLIRVYAPFAGDQAGFSLMLRPAQPPDTSGAVGAVTSGSILESSPTHVFLGHESGHISIWCAQTFECVEVIRVNNSSITALCGAGELLWAGYRTGYIYVYDVRKRPWRVVKAWKAHRDAVTHICVDASSLWMHASLHVISVGLDQIIHLWDGFLRSDWLAQAALELVKREADYCSYDSLRVLICSWNVDAAKPSDLSNDPVGIEVLQNMLRSVKAPDVIVFGLQEVIDLEDKRLTAKSILFGRKRSDTLHADLISGQYRLWHDKLVQAVKFAMPEDTPYSITHSESLVGLLSCVFVKHSERSRLRDIDVSTIKTGLGGRYGNKGAIASRFVIDDSSLCFLNCHLAAGQSHRRQRNKDLIEILETKAPFSDVHSTSGPDSWILGGNGEMIIDHSIIFLSGDLNYRIDMRRDTVIANVAEKRFDALLAHDQLLAERQNNSAFRLKYFSEAPITFAPTYKYDRGTDAYDTSEKARAPAWCDRILWRVHAASAVQVLHYGRHEAHISDHRPVTAGFVARTRKIDRSKKHSVEQAIATRWSEHEKSLIKKCQDWHINVR